MSKSAETNMIYVSERQRDERHREFVIVRCSICGVTRKAYISALNKGVGVKHGQSCSMALNDGTDDFRLFYGIYKGINRRVFNKNFKHYKYYGGRGIKNEFLNFTDFFNSMYQSYLKAKIEIHNVDLDRIDGNGNYSKENCRWISHKENTQNITLRSNQKAFTATSPTGEILNGFNIMEFARVYNLSNKCIWKCLKGILKQYKGWHFKYKTNE